LVTVLEVLWVKDPLPTTESFSTPKMLVLSFVDVFVLVLVLPLSLLLVLLSVYDLELVLLFVYELVLVLPPLLTLTALPPFVADAVPPELPDDDAESLVVLVLKLPLALLLSFVLVLEFVFPTSLLVALIVAPLLAAVH
jgi:hypothetical protein